MKLRFLFVVTVGLMFAAMAAGPAHAGPSLSWAWGQYPGTVRDCAASAASAFRSMGLRTDVYETHANGNADRYTSSVQCFPARDVVVYVIIIAGEEVADLERLRDRIRDRMLGASGPLK